MSNPHQSGSVGSTLTGGIQDISAILPLIGTEQCEKHVGSALEGGYLYAAAAPLSIFGSLGIVKAGISILISSISIPKYSLSFRNIKLSMGFSQHSKWLGARMLDDAGFQLPGTVAPLMGMDGTRYKAESRLIEILEEKHIDNPENISIKWKSREWNIMLGLFTIIAAAMSGTPYISLLVGPWRPTTHTPWLFPVLRTVGSCLATVCCQFLIQSRVISLMKNRILFMTIHHRLTNNLSRDNKVDLDHWLKQYLKWDVDIPAEQSLWSLEQFFSSGGSFTRPNSYLKEPPGHISIAMEKTPHFNEDFNRFRLRDLRNKHFPSPTFDYTFVLISWVILCLSLPATVAGYIGCFTLVSTSPGNGPLIWLGLEAVLSIVRILVWAWNPDFDEGTNITVKLKLTEELPLIATEEYNPLVFHLENTERKPFALIPDRQFLELITPYTGPLNRFHHSKNFAMYFTLTSGYEVSENPEKSGKQQGSLLMTFVDSNKQIATTLVQVGGVFLYFDAAVTLSPTSGKMEGKLQLVISRDHSWLTENAIPFDALAQYYKSIMSTLRHRRNLTQPSSLWSPVSTAEIQWKWNLRAQSSHLRAIQLTDRDRSYLDLGYEHPLKMRLIEKWSRWIVAGMESIRSDSQNDCYEALADVTSGKAEWELTELDSQLGWEWTRRELAILVSSIILEDILHERTENYIHSVVQEQKDKWLKEWIMSGFMMGRRKRLEKERGKMKERTEKEMKGASGRAEQEGRLWSDQGQFEPQWGKGFEFIDKQWSAGVDGGHAALKNAMSELDSLINESAPNFAYLTELEKTRFDFVDRVRQQFVHWHPQRENERRSMEAAIQRIRDVDGPREKLDSAYEYPEPDGQATRRFVELYYSTSKGKACSAIVYDVAGCNKEEVCDVIKKTTTPSVINVDPEIVASIPENDHLLFLSCEDGKGEEPAFIQRNRDQWWDRQRTNSSMFYFSPRGVFPLYAALCYAFSGPIAHIFIFLTAPSRVRLRLAHGSECDMSVSIQQDCKELRRILIEVPNQLRSQDLELDELGLGKHQLEVVAVRNSDGPGRYYLRGILIEFFNDPTPDSLADKDGGGWATTIKDRGADAEPSGSEGSISESTTPGFKIS